MQKSNLSEEEIKYILAQVVLGIQYLHNKRISHRDLKPANILLFPYLRVKISDFGLAKMTEKSMAEMTGCGTFMYAAPEVFKTTSNLKLMPFKPDIYSLGLIAAWMMNPAEPIDFFNVYQRSFEYPDRYSNQLMEFIYFCLPYKPEERPKIDQIAELEYLQEYIQYV